MYVLQNFYKRKILLYLRKLKSISEKHGKKNHALKFKVLKCIYIFELTDRFICEHILIDLLF